MPGTEDKPWWKDCGCLKCEEMGNVLASRECSLSSVTYQSRMFNQWCEHSKTCRVYNKTPPRKGNGAPQGAFAFTITKSPKDPYSIGDMLTAVRKIMAQKTVPVVKYAWYYEDKGRDENGDAIHPHIHGMYETSTMGRIPRRQFERAWKLWDETKPIGAGFRGGYHRPVKHDEAYSNYISKDGGMSESKGLEDNEETE